MTEEQRDQTHVEQHGDGDVVVVPEGDTGSVEDLEQGVEPEGDGGEVE